MDIQSIKNRIKDYQAQGKNLFATSSFQSHSIPLLHIISEIDREIPVYYLNTGFLFPETIDFIDSIAELLGINCIPVEPSVSKIQQRDHNGNFFYTSDPDYCCYLNKTKPTEGLLKKYDVWVNGVRADQNANRKQMQVEQNAPFDTIRFHPILDWDSKMIHEYQKKYSLPAHPLEAQGYFSIGCEPCTRKLISDDDERSARWFGLNKTECGLHTDLAK